MTRRLMALIGSLGALILTHGATTRPGTRTKNLYVVRLDDAVWDRPQFRKKTRAIGLESRMCMWVLPRTTLRFALSSIRPGTGLRGGLGDTGDI